MIRRIMLAAAVSATALPLAVAAPAQATTSPVPGRITAITARPGPGPGQVTFSWRHDDSHTTGYRIETGLTTFSTFSPGLPNHGRNAQYFNILPGRSSVTLSARRLARSGATVGSGNHLYFRFQAINRTRSGVAVRKWPYLQTVAPKPAAAPTTGTPLRVASFNVHTAGDRAPGRSWSERVPRIARQIAAYRPGIVTLQELEAGRADGRSGKLDGTKRQTTSLVDALAAAGGRSYRLVRSTRYTAPGETVGHQDTRILYDASRYKLVSNCRDTTAGSAWSSSCTIKPPALAGEASRRRWAAYGVFEDKASGQRFYAVSVHTEPRHSRTLAVEHRYEQLREGQVESVISRINKLNTGNLPVVVAGDLNGGQNNYGGNRAHDSLVAAGFFDTADAASQTRVRYGTYNGFARTVRRPSSGWGNRIDAIMVKGIRSAVKFNNVMRVTQSGRPSDHNMIVADVRLP